MTQAVPLDLFAAPAVVLPREHVWYQGRLLKREVLPSTSKGYLYRLSGCLDEPQFETAEGPLPVWKPVTDDAGGARWVEAQLRTFGWDGYRFAKARRGGLGRYVATLLDALLEIRSMRMTVYLYQHPTHGDFWTVHQVRPR